jgi:diguanylate cyclase (GGDEF)-like protein
MGNAILNLSMVKISILIMFIMCLVLMGLVFTLAVSLWRMRDKLKQEKIRARHAQSHKNYITGLDNRAVLMETLESLLESSRQTKANIALLFIDIDDFNSINGSLGVKFGDLLLHSLGERILKEVTAFSKLVYHIGSDEFAVVLYDYGENTESVADISNDIIHAVSQPVNAQGYVLQTTCCIGICTFPDCAADAEELVKHAGSARDNAKKLGFGSYSFYTQEMSKKSVIRALISADLRHALERNEFVLHYQPKVVLKTGAIQGAEALLRWHHPTLGNITPDIFIPVIEDLGLIHAVGRWVINTACRDISMLHKEGYDQLHIAINLSAHQFDKGDIGSIIAEAIWETGIAPQKVELELTEAVVMSDTEKTLLMLKVLQSMGVKIAVDDFGTGYSSMNQLTKFPISILKVDRCFIHDMHKNPANHAIVSTIIRMSKQLGFEVVAEGVECDEELEILRTEECDLIQGFYYSKALPMSEFTKYVREHKVAYIDKDIPTEQEDVHF